MDTQPDEAKPPASSSIAPPQALSPPRGLLPLGLLSALRSWVPRGPPPGPVASNPMGSPASPPYSVISWPHAGKFLTTYHLHLWAGPPQAICPSFNTTAAVVGMCYFPFLILLLLLSISLTSCANKIPLIGATAFLSFNITALLPHQAGLATSPWWLFCFYLLSVPKSPVRPSFA